MVCLSRPYHLEFSKDCRRATLLKKETLAQVFSCEFWEISKNTVSTENLQTTASGNQDTNENNLEKPRKQLFILIISRISRKKAHKNPDKVFVWGLGDRFPD